jgi:hypothetical protein
MSWASSLDTEWLLSTLFDASLLSLQKPPETAALFCVPAPSRPRPFRFWLNQNGILDFAFDPLSCRKSLSTSLESAIVGAKPGADLRVIESSQSVETITNYKKTLWLDSRPRPRNDLFIINRW